MDFRLALSFPFQDEEWVRKLAIAGALSLTIIDLIPVFGWSLEVNRRLGSPCGLGSREGSRPTGSPGQVGSGSPGNPRADPGYGQSPACRPLI